MQVSFLGTEGVFGTPIAVSSTFIFPTRTRPAISTASSSTMGATIRHGPHHGAHMSRSTGSGDCSTSAANDASVTVMGPLETGSGVLQRPQIAAHIREIQDYLALRSHLNAAKATARNSESDGLRMRRSRSMRWAEIPSTSEMG